MPTFPSKKERDDCWVARDAYFSWYSTPSHPSCTDNSIWVNGLSPSTHEEVLSIHPARPQILTESAVKDRTERKRLFACKKEFAFFQSKCLASWVEHFSLLRVKEMQKYGGCLIVGRRWRRSWMGMRRDAKLVKMHSGIA
jgi:hypothetical protein